MILTKAIREARAGRLSNNMRVEINKRFHVDIHEPRKTFGGSDFTEDERQPKVPVPEVKKENRSDNIMTLEEAQLARIEAERKTVAAEARAVKAEGDLEAMETRATVAEAKVTELDGQVRAIATEVEGIEVTAETKTEDVVRSVGDHIREVAPLAKQAVDLREATITEALDAGVRAYDDDFDQEKKRSFLEKLDLTEIKETGDGWERDAKASGKFKGGRTSADEGEDEPFEEPKNRADNSIPPGAYSQI